MTTVVVTNVPGPDYLWSGSTFGWLSGESKKAWQSAKPYDYTATITEDVVTFTEKTDKSYGKNMSEGFALTESRAASFEKNTQESFAFEEALSNQVNFVRGFSENLAISDKIASDFYKELSETFAMSELPFSKAVVVNVSESLVIAEVYARTMAYGLLFEESLSVTDALSKASSLSFSELVKFLDYWPRKSGQVFSDIRFRSVPVGVADFEKIMAKSSAAGYQDFTTFVPGDYDIKTALLKVVATSSNVDRARIKSLNVVVDMPDVLDRGVMEIAATATFVPFNRVFTVPPDVTTTLKGGSVFAVPRVAAGVTTTGFYVTLEKPDGTLTSGFISWSAHGY